jgi:hypothetical protein
MRLAKLRYQHVLHRTGAGIGGGVGGELAVELGEEHDAAGDAKLGSLMLPRR